MMSDTPEPIPRPIDDDSVERITRFNEGAIQGLPTELQDQYVSVQSEGIEPSYLLIYAEKEREATAACAAASRLKPLPQGSGLTLTVTLGTPECVFTYRNRLSAARPAPPRHRR